MTSVNLRILLIDDNAAIHEDYRKILAPEPLPVFVDAEAEAALFGSSPAPTAPTEFQLDSAYQGQEGLTLLEQAQSQGQPYAMAFVDIRMPPGWDGIETITRLWQVDPDLQVVIATAYSDYSWKEIASRFDRTDSLVILKKPFDPVEVLQLAHALTRKWKLAQQAEERFADLDQVVSQRTRDLQAANRTLLHEIAERKSADRRTAAFSTLGQRLSAANTSKDAARIIVEVADQLLGWDACLCASYLPAENLVCHILSLDLINGCRCECLPKQLRHPPTDSARRAIREGGFLLLRDNPQASPADEMRFGDTSRASASILFVPIRNGEDVAGVLSIQSYTPRAYDQRSLETLQALADHCGAALDRIKTEEALRAAQEQLRQSQKLEAIGQLAGGVAHDFNNLLAVIRGNIDLVLHKPAALLPESLEGLNQVVAATDRAANLTRQLLTFSRKQVMEFKPLNLSLVVGNLTKMLKRVIGEDIHLLWDPPASLPSVQADVGMLEQALVNLVVNARDAMPRGGQLLIATAAVHLSADHTLGRPDARPGQFVTLTVRDTGSGIAPEHLPHIFEPFFTTKEIGKGTGLGLATVYGIVKQHQGWIEVASQLGSGAAFTLFLPASPSASVAPARPVSASPSGGTETILLVEDDEAVRSLTRRILERHGYRVHEAASGMEALQLWPAQGAGIDLLLTDVIMPQGITGRELAERLRADRPALKVIFTSGYSGEVLGRDTDFLRRMGSPFLSKPCAPAELLATLRQCLDKPLAQ